MCSSTISVLNCDGGRVTGHALVVWYHDIDLVVLLCRGILASWPWSGSTVRYCHFSSRRSGYAPGEGVTDTATLAGRAAGISGRSVRRRLFSRFRGTLRPSCWFCYRGSIIRPWSIKCILLYRITRARRRMPAPSLENHCLRCRWLLSNAPILAPLLGRLVIGWFLLSGS